MTEQNQRRFETQVSLLKNISSLKWPVKSTPVIQR